jgi:hypothetical protein
MGDEEVDAAEFEDLPTTDIDVAYHVHYGMTGSFPLRMAELFFANDGVHIAEYAYITPLFGLGFRKHRREAEGMDRIYEIHGIDEVLLQADQVHWINPDGIERVVVYSGGWLGRPKVAVYTSDGLSYAYRLHDEVEFSELVDGIADWADPYDVPVEDRDGLGFTPVESLWRFLNR